MVYEENRSNDKQWEMARRLLREEYRDLLDQLNTSDRRDGDEEFGVFANKYFARRVGAMKLDELPDVYNLATCGVFWAKSMNEFAINWNKLLQKLDIVQSEDGLYHFAEEYHRSKTASLIEKTASLIEENMEVVCAALSESKDPRAAALLEQITQEYNEKADQENRSM